MPSRSDDRAGQPWSGPAGDKFKSILAMAGVDIGDCYFTSLLKCRPNSDEVSDDAALMCVGYLLTELYHIKPKIVFVTGQAALSLLLKNKLKIGSARGKVHKVDMPWGTVNVVATWSSGYAMHKHSVQEDIIADVLTARAHLSPARVTDYRWIEKPSHLVEITDKIIKLYQDGGLKYGFIAPDTESTNLLAEDVPPTPYLARHNIASIQIAWNPGEAFIVPVIRDDSAFNNPYDMSVLQAQMARLLEIPTVGQNYKYDEGYFNIKLGIKSKKFIFDTMLGHHFLNGGSLPNDLGFLTSRYLGWESHKHIIDKELAAMDPSVRSYGKLSRPVITEYGCKDSDATLQVAPILMDMLRNTTYEKYNRNVIYANMLEAFNARVMFPWRAILNMEQRGAPIDVEKVPEVTSELERRMSESFSVIGDSPPHAVWLVDHTVDNPKYRVYKKKTVYVVDCGSCGNEYPWVDEGKRPKTTTCRNCRSDKARVTHRRINTSEFIIAEGQPEKITSPINLRSPDQVSEFFYNPRYLGLPIHDKLGRTTNKHARAWLTEFCEARDLHIHVRILQSIGEYNKASKLYSSYATKLPKYMFVTCEDDQISKSATAPFEQKTGILHIHTNYYQDGTVSGRLCVSRDTKIMTNLGEVSVDEIVSNVSRQYHALTHTGQWKPITRAFFKGREQMFSIRTESGGSIKCTGGHQILTRDGWVAAKNLSKGSRVCSYRFPRDSGCWSHYDKCIKTEPCILVNEYLRDNSIDCSRVEGMDLPEGGAIEVLLGGLYDRGSTVCGDRWVVPQSVGHEKTGQSKRRPYCGKRITSTAVEHERIIPQPEFMYVEDRIVSIDVDDVCPVWDIEVDEDHSYVAQGMIHHNSTRDPSLHVIPRKSAIKGLFISRFGEDGLILQADLSQAEVRGFVIETGDDDLRIAFNNGVDPYITMASKTYSVPMDKVTDDQRQDNKSIVLGLLFGRGATAIAEQTKKPVNIIKEVIANFFNSVPKIKNWIDEQHRFVEEFKCAVSRFGRIRPLIDQIESDDDGMLNHAHNISVNHPIQGMVGDLCIDSVARIEYRTERENLTSVLFNTVHDSSLADLFISEIKTLMPLMHQEMFTKLPEYFPWINVPFALDFEIGPNWQQTVKASLDGDLLSLNGDPGIISVVLTRLKRHFNVQTVSADIVTKDKKDSLKIVVGIT